jgi:hypothetical protein
MQNVGSERAVTILTTILVYYQPKVETLPTAYEAIAAIPMVETGTAKRSLFAAIRGLQAQAIARRIVV